MAKPKLPYVIIIGLFVSVLVCGCVERKLTINTHPQGALVVLNDEEIGESPVTVNFDWYGDYSVRLSKEGYQTLDTHRNLKGPWYDSFPWDFFAEIVDPHRIVDSYEWTFELSLKQPVSPEELIRSARSLKEQVP
jgi:PEGA domain